MAAVVSPTVYKKTKIPKALREEVWRAYVGSLFETKCTITWCTNSITVFNFEAGHNIPESRGGATQLSNLRPICGSCNKSMGNRYTITQWNDMSMSMTAKRVEVVPTGSAWCCWRNK